MHLYSSGHILVCSFQNETADLLYEALEKIHYLKDTIVRVYALRMIRKIEKNPDTMKFMTNTYHKTFKEEEKKQKAAKAKDHLLNKEKIQLE